MSETQTKKKKSRIMRFIMLVALILLAIIFFNLSAVTTYQNEFSVIKQFGEIVSVRDEAGLTFKVPFIQTVEKYPSSVQFYDIPVSTITTSDKKNLIVDAIITWRITDPHKFLNTLRGSLSEAENRLSTIAYEKMKAITSATLQADVISNRDTLAAKIYESIAATPNDYGVEIIRLETKRLDLPDENKATVYSRMIAERQSIAAQYRSDGQRDAQQLRNDTDRDVLIMVSNAERDAAAAIARGETAYMTKMAEAYSTSDKAAFYAFQRSLEGLEASLNSTSSTKIVLGPESPLVDALNSEHDEISQSNVIVSEGVEE